MKWEVEKSRNASYTLKVNGIYLYSKYNPENDVKKFIEAEADSLMECYLLVGMGLGYHIEALLEKTQHQLIYVFLLDSKEIELLEKYGDCQLLNDDRVVVVGLDQVSEVLAMDKMQVIIPLQWIKAIASDHPLHDILSDIKTRQMSFKASKLSLANNFNRNLQNDDPTIVEWKQYYSGQKACLVSAGPSLNETIDLLNKIREEYFIISVGSALKVLLQHAIIPDVVIITDPSKNVVNQIDNTTYEGPLFYLSTANHEMTQIHKNDRYIIFQEGYPYAENYAKSANSPFVETGGSVATTALSLLEYMGFHTVYLFGQDLGFREGRTHAEGSTSGVAVMENNNFRRIKANSGKMIYTTPNLQVYQRWFEGKAERTRMNIYNTAWNGANIKGVSFISEMDLLTKAKSQNSEEKRDERTI